MIKTSLFSQQFVSKSWQIGRPWASYEFWPWFVAQVTAKYPLRMFCQTIKITSNDAIAKKWQGYGSSNVNNCQNEMKKIVSNNLSVIIVVLKVVSQVLFARFCTVQPISKKSAFYLWHHKCSQKVLRRKVHFLWVGLVLEIKCTKSSEKT